MNTIRDSSTTRRIFRLLLLYRLATLVFVAILGLAGWRTPVWVLATAVIYTSLIIIFKSAIYDRLRSRPYMLALDMLITFLITFSVGPQTPYYLYTFGAVFLGAFLFSYSGGLAFTVLAYLILVTHKYIHGYTLQVYIDYGEHLGTYFFFYLIMAMGMAYISELVTKLDEAKEKEQSVASELNQAKRCLELSMVVNRLSIREMQVLTLCANGEPIDRIAAELDVSRNTVKSYLKRIYEKLNVSSKPELTSWIARQNNDES